MDNSSISNQRFNAKSLRIETLHYWNQGHVTWGHRSVLSGLWKPGSATLDHIHEWHKNFWIPSSQAIFRACLLRSPHHKSSRTGPGEGLEDWMDCTLLRASCCITGISLALNTGVSPSGQRVPSRVWWYCQDGACRKQTWRENTLIIYKLFKGYKRSDSDNRTLIPKCCHALWNKNRNKLCLPTVLQSAFWGCQFNIQSWAYLMLPMNLFNRGILQISDLEHSTTQPVFCCPGCP